MGTTKLLTAGGGGVNIQPASSIASDVTVNVPSSNGTLVSTGETAQVSQAMLASGVAGNGPAFSAYQSINQAITGSTFTKITFDAEEFDTNNNFASSRFTPSVAGYYFVNAGVSCSTNAIVSVYKNGTEYKRCVQFNTAQTGNPASALVYCNGSTDYVEIYVYFGTSVSTNSGSISTYFQASMVRSA